MKKSSIAIPMFLVVRLSFFSHEETKRNSKKKRGVRTGPNLVEVNLPQAIPDILSRQIVLEQVTRIDHSLGLVYSFTLIAKVYLRKTWSRILEWDNRLPDDLCAYSGSSSSPLFSG